MKYIATIEYDGTNFFGWQKQPELRTIQQVLEDTLSKIANEKILVYSSGRTDKGVHAKEQVIHFNSDAKRDIKNWIFGLNSLLPSDITVLSVKTIYEDFHARFSAISRTYKYVIYNSSIRSSLNKLYSLHYGKTLNTNRMQLACKYLLGEHDFTTFRGSDCQSLTPIREIYSILIKKDRDFLFIRITANSFLQHMVRNIVGALLLIGSGKKDSFYMKEILDKKNRNVGYPTAPAHGLFLEKIMYRI